LTGIYLNNLSGQTSFDPKESLQSVLWGAQMSTTRAEASAKTGYVFPNKEWKSFGFQANAVWHQQTGQYGWRNYQGAQQYMRLNALFATIIRDDRQKMVMGLSAIIDEYDERVFFDRIPPIALQSIGLRRNELTLGGFIEHTWMPNSNFVAVTGGRIDHHNKFGWMPTPRLHLRWSLNELTSIKAMFGIGRRMPNAFMDNVGLFASNRGIQLPDPNDTFAGGLAMERASNMGLILARKGKLWHRAASMAIDVYYTQFYNQAVVDFEVPEVVSFYNLNGKSYSKSAQCEIQYTPLRRLDVRMAYRWLEVKTQYASGFLDKPLVNKHRAFINLAYETKATKKDALWRMDATLQWISQKRIPTSGHIHVDQPMTWSPGFEQLSAQVTRVFSKSLEIYLGGENLTNFMVHNPIFSAENPQDKAFDSSLIWGPVFGRMVYVGLRWNLL
jgi:outer membrane receptor for ferrienterochelin and colicins